MTKRVGCPNLRHAEEGSRASCLETRTPLTNRAGPSSPEDVRSPPGLQRQLSEEGFQGVELRASPLQLAVVEHRVLV